MGGSADVSGEGLMRGMRLKWEIYRWSVAMGKLLKSIWTRPGEPSRLESDCTRKRRSLM